jgi:hypothetical protein
MILREGAKSPDFFFESVSRVKKHSTEFTGFDRNGWRFVTELAGHHFKTSKWWKKHANLSNKYCEI